MDSKTLRRARQAGLIPEHDGAGQSAFISQFEQRPEPAPNHWPPVGWLGWYTKKGGERWFSCEVIAHDGGEPVVKTGAGCYRRRPVGEYEFTDRMPKNVGR